VSRQAGRKTDWIGVEGPPSPDLKCLVGRVYGPLDAVVVAIPIRGPYPMSFPSTPVGSSVFQREAGDDPRMVTVRCGAGGDGRRSMSPVASTTITSAGSSAGTTGLGTRRIAGVGDGRLSNSANRVSYREVSSLRRVVFIESIASNHVVVESSDALNFFLRCYKFAHRSKMASKVK
jgi:hypothetical protein